MFWQNYALLCSENDMTPNAVCAALGLSSATATHWKNGRIPNGETLSAIADFFDVTVDYLLGRTPPISSAPTLSDTEQELVELFRSLSPEQAEMLLLTARTAAAQNDRKAAQKEDV